MNPDPQEFTNQNRRAWNEIAEVRNQKFPPAAFFAQGGCTLSARLIEAAQISSPTSLPLPLRARHTRGTPKGRGRGSAGRVIHLQCATGEDTLSWAGLGMEAYGIDIS